MPSLLTAERVMAVCIAVYVVVHIVSRASALSMTAPKYCWETARWAWPVFESISPTGRMDNCDRQWRQFRRESPKLAVGLLCYVAVMKFIRWACVGISPFATLRRASGGFPPVVEWHCMQRSLLCQAMVNLCVLLYLHRSGIIFVLLHWTAFYLWAKMMSRRLPAAVYFAVPWTAAVLILVWANANEGFGFAYLRSLGPPFDAVVAWLDAPGIHYNAAPVRWYIVASMSTLHILAYVYDSWEARERSALAEKDRDDEPYGANRPAAAAYVHDSSRCVDCVEKRRQCYKARTAQPRREHELGFIPYFAYLSYFPLYIAGPISSFNGFISHQFVPQGAVNGVDLVRYAARGFFSFLLLMTLLHVAFITCFMTLPGYISSLTINDQAGVMLLALAFLWLKFNVMWKFFRFWALVDGIEVPENMLRCFASTTTISEFWRDWHASFNLWIVRYMYIPLGGAKARVRAIVPIFVFVALWHDVHLAMVRWAGIMCATFACEVMVSRTIKRIGIVRDLMSSTDPRAVVAARYLQYVGGALSTFSLIVANIVGFGVQNGSLGAINELFSLSGLSKLSFIIATLAVGNIIATWSRAFDRRRLEEREQRLFGKGQQYQQLQDLA
jgi:D-alanyl-lipoteichoic acid acyltransferase DltB (MBOAT superfamily)